MSQKQNDVLWDLKREEVEEWLGGKGYDLGELMRDADGYYILSPAKFCTSQDPRCEVDEFCGCKDKVYLPDNLQHL